MSARRQHPPPPAAPPAAPPMRAILFGVVVSAGFFIFLSVSGWLPDTYFKAWSPDTVFFDEFKIDTAHKFTYAFTFVFINTCVNKYTYNIYNTWKITVVNDHKTMRCEIPATDAKIHLTVQIYNIYSALSYSVNIFFLFTNAYFALAQMAAGGLVHYYVTKQFLARKADYGRYSSGGCSDDEGRGGGAAAAERGERGGSVRCRAAVPKRVEGRGHCTGIAVKL